MESITTYIASWIPPRCSPKRPRQGASNHAVHPKVPENKGRKRKIKRGKMTSKRKAKSRRAKSIVFWVPVLHVLIILLVRKGHTTLCIGEELPLRRSSMSPSAAVDVKHQVHTTTDTFRNNPPVPSILLVIGKGNSQNRHPPPPKGIPQILIGTSKTTPSSTHTTERPYDSNTSAGSPNTATSSFSQSGTFTPTGSRLPTSGTPTGTAVSNSTTTCTTIRSSPPTTDISSSMLVQTSGPPQTITQATSATIIPQTTSVTVPTHEPSSGSPSSAHRPNDPELENWPNAEEEDYGDDDDEPTPDSPYTNTESHEWQRCVDEDDCVGEDDFPPTDVGEIQDQPASGTASPPGLVNGFSMENLDTFATSTNGLQTPHLNYPLVVNRVGPNDGLAENWIEVDHPGIWRRFEGQPYSMILSPEERIVHRSNLNTTIDDLMVLIDGVESNDE